MREHVLAVACVFALVGCKGDIISSKTPLNSSPLPTPPRSASEVEIFTTTPPTKAYVEIAKLSASDQSCISCPKNTEAELLTRLRSDAAKAGCDGLVMEAEKRAVAGQDYGGSFGGSEYTSQVRGICIVFE